jgi:serine phosphatase RsbU (regulator of sigma subunit)
MALLSGSPLLFFRRLLVNISPSAHGIWKECYIFSQYLEKFYFPQALKEEFETVEWEVTAAPFSMSIKTGPGPTDAIYETSKLAGFLNSLGIQTVSMDTRLESNQIVDIFLSLYLLKKSIKKGETRKINEAAREMFSPDGLNLYCAIIRLDAKKGHLSIAYSYCELTFSRAVSTFKKRSKIFKDHRSFFYAAPRYGFLIGMTIIAIPVGLRFLMPGYEFAVLSLVAILVGILTYVLFQTIGSIEYDKEYQQGELFKSHRALEEKQWLINQDLEKAVLIQKRLIPGENFRFENIEVAALLKPQSQVGGDFYDLWQTPDGHLIIMVVDCVGHGLFSALIATAIKSVFLNLQGVPRLRADQLMATIKSVLERILPSGFFAALTYVDIDIRNSKVSLLNAGNPFPLLITETGEIQTMNHAVSSPLGIASHGAWIEPHEFEIKKGSKLVLLTDGVVEARNVRGEYYSVPRLEEILRQKYSLSALELRDFAIGDVRKFSEGASQSDDQTLLVIQVL